MAGFRSNLIGNVKEQISSIPKNVSGLFDKDNYSIDTNVDDFYAKQAKKGQEEAKNTTLPLGTNPQTSLKDMRTIAQTNTPEAEVAKKQLSGYAGQSGGIDAAIFGAERAGKADAETNNMVSQGFNLLAGGVNDLYNKATEKIGEVDFGKVGETALGIASPVFLPKAIKNIREGGFIKKKTQSEDNSSLLYKIRDDINEQVGTKRVAGISNTIKEKEDEIKRIEDQQTVEQKTAIQGLMEQREKLPKYEADYTNLTEQIKKIENMNSGKSLDIIRNEIAVLEKEKNKVTQEEQNNSAIRANFYSKPAREQSANILGNIANMTEDVDQRGFLLHTMSNYLEQRKKNYDRQVASGLFTQEQADNALLNDMQNQGINHIQTMKNIYDKNKVNFTDENGNIDGDKLRIAIEDSEELKPFITQQKQDRLDAIISSNEKKVQNANFLTKLPQMASSGIEDITEMFITPGTEAASDFVTTNLFGKNAKGYLGNNTRERFTSDLADPYDTDINILGFDVDRTNRIAVGGEMLRGLVEDPTIFLTAPKAAGVAFKAEGMVGRLIQGISKGSNGKIFGAINAIDDGADLLKGSRMLSNLENAITVEQRLANMGTKALSKTLGVDENVASRIVRGATSAVNEMVAGMPLNIILSAKTSKGADSEWGLNFGLDAGAGFILPGLKRLGDIDNMVNDIRTTAKNSPERANLITKRLPFISEDVAKSMSEMDVNDVVKSMSDIANSQTGQEVALGINGMKAFATEGDIDYINLGKYIKAIEGADNTLIPETAREVFEQSKAVLSPLSKKIDELAQTLPGSDEFIQKQTELKSLIGDVVDSYNTTFVKQIVSDRTVQKLSSDVINTQASVVKQYTSEKGIQISDGQARAIVMATYSKNKQSLKILENVGITQNEIAELSKGTQELLAKIDDTNRAKVENVIKAIDIENGPAEIEKIAENNITVKIPKKDVENIDKIKNMIKNATDEDIPNIEKFSSAVSSLISSLGKKVKNAEVKFVSAAGAIRKSYQDFETAVLVGLDVDMNQYKSLYNEVGGNIKSIVDEFINIRLKNIKGGDFTKEDLLEAFNNIIGKTKEQRDAVGYTISQPESIVNPLVDYIQSVIGVSKNGIVSDEEIAFIAQEIITLSNATSPIEEVKGLANIIKDIKSKTPNFTDNSYVKFNKIDISKLKVEADSIPGVLISGDGSGKIPPLQKLLNDVMKGSKKAVETLSNNTLYFTTEARDFLSNTIGAYGGTKEQKTQFIKMYNEAFANISSKNVNLARTLETKFFDGETKGLLINVEGGESFLPVLDAIGSMYTKNGIHEPAILQMFKYLDANPGNEPLLEKLFNTITDSPETQAFLTKMGYESYWNMYKGVKETLMNMLEREGVEDTKAMAEEILSPLLFNPQRTIDVFGTNFDTIMEAGQLDQKVLGNVNETFIANIIKQRKNSNIETKIIPNQIKELVDNLSKKKGLDGKYFGSFYNNEIIFNTLEKVYKFFGQEANFADVAAKNSKGQSVILFEQIDNGLEGTVSGLEDFMFKTIYSDIIKNSSLDSSSYVSNIISTFSRGLKSEYRGDIEKVDGLMKYIDDEIMAISKATENANLEDSIGVITGMIKNLATDISAKAGIDITDGSKLDGYIGAIENYAQVIANKGSQRKVSGVVKRYMIDYARNTQDILSQAYKQSKVGETAIDVSEKIATYADMERFVLLDKLESLGIGLDADLKKLTKDIAYNTDKSKNTGFIKRLNVLEKRMEETAELARDLNQPEKLIQMQKDLDKLNSGELKLSATQKQAMEFLKKISEGFDPNAYLGLPEYREIMNRTQDILDSSVVKNKAWKEYYLLDEKGILQTYSKEGTKWADRLLMVAANGARHPEIRKMSVDIENGGRSILSESRLFGSQKMSMKVYRAKASNEFAKVTDGMPMSEVNTVWNKFIMGNAKDIESMKLLPKKQQDLLKFLDDIVTDIDTYRSFNKLGTTKSVGAIVDDQPILSWIGSEFVGDNNKYPGQVVNALLGSWMYMDFRAINRLSKEYSAGIPMFKTNQLLGGLSTIGYNKIEGDFFGNISRRWNSKNTAAIEDIVNFVNAGGARMRFNIFNAPSQFTQQVISNTLEALSIYKNTGIDPQVLDDTFKLLGEKIGFEVYGKIGTDIVEDTKDVVSTSNSLRSKGVNKVMDVAGSPMLVSPYLADHTTKLTVMKSAIAGALYKYSEAGLGTNGVKGFLGKVGEMNDFVGKMDELYKAAGKKGFNESYLLNNSGLKFLQDNLAIMDEVDGDMINQYKQFSNFYKTEYDDFIGAARTHAATFFVQDKVAELAAIPRMSKPFGDKGMTFGPLGQKTFFAMQKWGIGKGAEYFRGIQEAYYKIGLPGIMKQFMLNEVNEINKPIFDFARQIVNVAKLNYQLNKVQQDGGGYTDALMYLVPAIAGFALSPLGGILNAAKTKFNVAMNVGDNYLDAGLSAVVAGLISPAGRLLPYIKMMNDAAGAAYITSQEIDDANLVDLTAVMLKSLVGDSLLGLNKTGSSKGEVIANPYDTAGNFVASMVGLRTETQRDLLTQNSILYALSEKIKGNDSIFSAVKRVFNEGIGYNNRTTLNTNDGFLKQKLQEYLNITGIGKLTKNPDYDDSSVNYAKNIINGNGLAEYIGKVVPNSFTIEDGTNALYEANKLKEYTSPFTKIVMDAISKGKPNNLIDAADGGEYKGPITDEIQKVIDVNNGKKSVVLTESDVRKGVAMYIRMGGTEAVAGYMTSYISGSRKLREKQIQDKYGLSNHEFDNAITNVNGKTVAPDFIHEYKALVDQDQDLLMRTVRPIVRKETGVIQTLQQKVMKYDPAFHLTSIKEVNDTSPKGSAAYILEEARSKDINMQKGLTQEGIANFGIKAQLSVMDALSSVDETKLQEPDMQELVKNTFNNLSNTIDILGKNTTDKKTQFVYQSSLATILAPRIDSMVKKFGPNIKEYLNKLDNTGDLSGAVENAVSGLTDSIPANIQTITEAISGLDLSGKGGGKGKKGKAPSYDGEISKLENYLQPINKMSKIAAENFNRPNQYEYTIAKGGASKQIKTTPIKQGGGGGASGNLTKKSFGGNISTGNLDTPGLPVKVGRVISQRRKPVAIGNSKVYSRKIGGK